MKIKKHLEIAKRIEKEFTRTNDLVRLKKSLIDAVIDYEAGYSEDVLYQILSIIANRAIEMIIELDDSLAYKDVYMQLNQIYSDKNHDYGDSFGETFEELGAISAVTRITDKINRLDSLMTKEQKVKDESILDTLIDLANYCIMTLIELEEE